MQKDFFNFLPLKKSHTHKDQKHEKIFLIFEKSEAFLKKNVLRFHEKEYINVHNNILLDGK